MTVRVGKMTFSDWTSLPIGNRYTDTFIFRIDARACLPPFVYAPLLRRIVAHVRQKRSCASLWIRVDSPGDWFVIEVQKSLRGLKIPYAVTHAAEQPDYRDFSVPPTLLHSRLLDPPDVKLAGVVAAIVKFGVGAVTVNVTVAIRGSPPLDAVTSTVLVPMDVKLQ